jgi:glucose-6-phosphate dehydrogenase assembly protein OpcA
MSVTVDGVWRAQNTSPSQIEAALRCLLRERRDGHHEGWAPARVLNLVVIIDRAYRGEIVGRLERVGRYHPSRMVVCAVEDGRDRLDAWATIEGDGDEPRPGELASVREHVEIELSPRHLSSLASIVDPILVPDLTTVVWSPHGYDMAVDALLGLSDVVLLDSLDEDPLAALTRVNELAEHAYVVDLAWLRSTPWRERLAAAFEPFPVRDALREISAVEVRHRYDSNVAALLFAGWLASRLGWRAGPLHGESGALHGNADDGGRPVKLCLIPLRGLDVPGLSGVSIWTESGFQLSLDRGPGGLRTVRRRPERPEQRFTVLGASRGEGGILGEGVRQALLRDSTYRPALAAARTFVGAE